MVNVSDLKYDVDLYEPSLVTNDEGGKERSFNEPFATVKGSVKRVNQFRALEAGADSLVDTDTVVIRFTKELADITKEWEVGYMGKVATIIEIKYEGLQNREWIKLTVREKVNGSTF